MIKSKTVNMFGQGLAPDKSILLDRGNFVFFNYMMLVGDQDSMKYMFSYA